jgi:hypothetical protein
MVLLNDAVAFMMKEDCCGCSLTGSVILYKTAMRTLAFGGSVGLFGEAPPNAAY